MSAFIGPLDMVTAEQLARVQAWIEKHGTSSVAVLTGTAPDPADFEDGEEVVDEREIEFTQGPPFLAGKIGETARRAVLRLGHSWRTVPLSSVEVHPRHSEVTALTKLGDYEQLEFPPPDCTFCEIALTSDGDGWYCDQCGAGWDYPGTRCTRKCVEPDCDADQAATIGEDKQPRCTPCAFRILVGAIEATPPYRCSNSWCRHTEVIGMPYEAKARRSGYKPVCGGCQQKADSDAWLENYLARSPRPTVSTESL